MSESPYIVHLDETNLIDVVVEGSMKQPVLVDFWADWCQPCKHLMPVLEKLVEEYNGAFILAKLDADAHQDIVAQMGVRGFPTCRLFVNKQAVDEFTGALPESEVRRFLEQYISTDDIPPADAEEVEAAPPEATPIQQAMALAERGDSENAKAVLKAAQAEDPENTDVLVMLGQLSVADNELETASSCLKAMTEEAREEPAAKRLAGTIALAEAADMSVNLDQLSQTLSDNPKDSAARYQMALHTALQGDLQGGMDHLLEVVKHDANYEDGAARNQLIALFDVLGSDPLAGQYRRKMFALLH